MPEQSKDRKYDFVRDTKNGKDLGGYTMEQIIQAGWYALMSRNEQNDKNAIVRELVQKDPRFKDIKERAKKAAQEKVKQHA